MKNDIIQYLRNKSILILGYGKEGKSALAFIQENLPDNAVAVADKEPISIDGVLCFSGADYLRHCHDFDVIIKSPGVEISSAKKIKKRLHRSATSSFVSVKILSSVLLALRERAPRARSSITFLRHVAKTPF